MLLKRKNVDKQTLKKWRTYMFDTTYRAISEDSGLSTRTICEAIANGHASQTTIDKLNEFFEPAKIPA